MIRTRNTAEEIVNDEMICVQHPGLCVVGKDNLIQRSRSVLGEYGEVNIFTMSAEKGFYLTNKNHSGMIISRL